MKYYYCLRCSLPFKRLFNCEYEKNDNAYFFFVPNVHLSAAKFFKKLLNQNQESLFQSVY